MVFSGRRKIENEVKKKKFKAKAKIYSITST